MIPRIALNSALVKKIRPAYMTPTNRLLFDIDDSASIDVDATNTCSSENSVIAGIRKRLSRTKVRLPANRICTKQQHHRGQPGHPNEEQKQDGKLPGDILSARERLRQVDLKGIGPPIVGDQPGADDKS